MINEIENNNLLKVNINKDYSVISNIEDILIDNNSQDNESKIKGIIKRFLSKSNANKISKKEKSLYIMEFLSKLKLNLRHNCTNEFLNKFITNKLIDDSNCRLVANFKENMLKDYIDEFLKRIYKYKECIERLPKFSKYYKNYSRFFCKPTFKDFKINKIIDRNGEKKAQIYYKNNYQGGKSEDDDENNGFAKSSSSDEDYDDKKNKKQNPCDVRDIKDLSQLFDESTKEKIENVTIMTTINYSLNNTINLKIDNEKIEVFSENKCDKSNDTTLHDIMDIIKNKKKKHITIKKDENNISNIKKEKIKSNEEKIDNSNKIKAFNSSDQDSKSKSNSKIIAANTKNNNKKINLNSLNKHIKDKIKKIIQNGHTNKNSLKKSNKRGLNLEISPSLKIKDNKNLIDNNSDLINLKKNSCSNKNKNNIKRSRNNNVGFLYKQTYTNYNNYFNNNIKFNSTNHNYFSKNIYSSLNNNNFTLKNNNKNNNNFKIIKNNINNSKYYITNSSLENKGVSMNILENYTSYNNQNAMKNNKKIKITQDNLIYKLKNQKHNNNFFNNYNNNSNLNKITNSNNNKSKNNNEIIIEENNINNMTKYKHQHYNSLTKKINYKPSISIKKKNKSIEPKLMGQILFDGNSSSSTKTFSNKLAQNNTKYFQNFYNHNNINNNYNININNQIIINTNQKNQFYNTNLKDFINNNIKKQNLDFFNIYKGRYFLKNEKTNPIQDILGSNNKIKNYKTRNINSSLHIYYSNPTNNEYKNKSNNNLGSLSNKIIKGYHNKKNPGISNYLSGNKNLIFLKKRSKNNY